MSVSGMSNSLYALQRKIDSIECLTGAVNEALDGHAGHIDVARGFMNELINQIQQVVDGSDLVSANLAQTCWASPGRPTPTTLASSSKSPRWLSSSATTFRNSARTAQPTWAA